MARGKKPIKRLPKPSRSGGTYVYANRFYWLRDTAPRLLRPDECLIWPGGETIWSARRKTWKAPQHPAFEMFTGRRFPTPTIHMVCGNDRCISYYHMRAVVIHTGEIMEIKAYEAIYGKDYRLLSEELLTRPKWEPRAVQ